MGGVFPTRLMGVGSPSNEREEVGYEPRLAELEVVRVAGEELELACSIHCLQTQPILHTRTSTHAHITCKEVGTKCPPPLLLQPPPLLLHLPLPHPWPHPPPGRARSPEVCRPAYLDQPCRIQTTVGEGRVTTPTHHDT